ncbi:hypothetical protein SLS56_004820 [Neofusicoccum ribis]|uniref:Uncharacterized protein n=1 Tax=Neofusicoccum ribis TaxID=45134 RepID=A0ABR3SVH2_9PEZI
MGRTPRSARRVAQAIAEEDETAATRSRKRRSRPMQRVPPSDDQRDSSSPLASLWANLLGPATNYVISVLAFAMDVLKPLISLAVAVLLFATFLSFARSWLSSSVSTALTPICALPGMSLLNLPFCEYQQKPTPASGGSVEFDELMAAQEAFDEIVISSTRNEWLPADMKSSENVIRDLRMVVRHSKLPSKSELEMEFNNFIETARQASDDLSRFNSRVGRAVDKTLSTTRWTMRVIDGLAENDSGRGAIDRFLWDNVLWALSPYKSPHAKLVEQYLQHTQTIESEIQGLIVQATTLLGILDTLEDQLGAIHDISIRDDNTLQGKREELFLQLWTKLGGNRSDVKKLDQEIQLLKNINTYRRSAVAHVSSTMVKLRAIAAHLEDLRERAAAPDVVGVDGEMPITLHIENIQRGLDRLQELRSQQIKGRDESYRRILDASSAGSSFQEGGVPKDRMIDGES